MENEGKEDAARGTREELRALIAEFDTAMLIGIERDGTLRARPMGLQPEPLDDCDLWFASADDTHKIEEIDRHDEVNICCMRTRDRAYLSLSARARIDRNPSEARRLWQPSWKLWLGDEKPEDGGIVLIKLEVERAEYWDPDGGRPRVVYVAPDESAHDEAAEGDVR